MTLLELPTLMTLISRPSTLYPMVVRLALTVGMEAVAVTTSCKY